MTQLRLDPFIPGGFMEKWLRFMSDYSPDVAKKKLSELKVLGAIILNTVAKTYINFKPIYTGNGILGFLGQPGSAKSWIADILPAFLPEIPHGSPQSIIERIEEIKNGLYIVYEVGEALRNASRGGYMSEWGNMVLLKLYNLEALSLGRVEKGKKTKRSVYIPYLGYYVSTVLLGTEEDFAGLFDIWPAMRRRILFLNFGETLPIKIWPFTKEESEAFLDLVRLCADLRKKAFLLFFPWDFVTEKLRKIEDHFYMKVGDRTIARMWAEYAIKLFAATLVDKALSVDTVENTHTLHTYNTEFNQIHQVIESESVYSEFRHYSLLFDVFPSIRDFLSSCGVETVELIVENDLSTVESTLVSVETLLFDIFFDVYSTLPSVSPSPRELRFIRVVEKLKNLLNARSKWRLRDLARKFSHKQASYEEVRKAVKELEERGEVKTWAVGSGKRRTVWVVSRTHPCCLNCKHFKWDSASRTYCCDLNHDFSELNYDLTRGCKDFEHEVEEE